MATRSSPSKGKSPEGTSPKRLSSSPPAAITDVSGEVTTIMHPEIEAESYSDSAYSDSDLDSFTTSLKTSVLNYVYENGRRYHSLEVGHRYFMPNDEEESDRLDLSHHLMTIIQKGALHAAPIGDTPQKILDLGTGTGIWSIEMADRYPSAHVIGIDISPIQPKWVPPNLTFEVDDIEKDWSFGKDTFDLIYSRYMLGAIGDWPKLTRQAYKALKPGAYLEILEPAAHLISDDGSLPPDSSLMMWNNLFVEAASKFGRSVVEAPLYKDYLLDAGFVNIHEDIFKLPNSPWPKNKLLKEAGGYQMVNFLEALEGLSLRMFQAAYNMSIEEIQVLLAKVRSDLKNKSIHTYYNLHRYVAQKPHEDLP